MNLYVHLCLVPVCLVNEIINMALFNESGVSEGLDLDMALLIDSDNELMGYVPDTPR